MLPDTFSGAMLNSKEIGHGFPRIHADNHNEPVKTYVILKEPATEESPKVAGFPEIVDR